MRTRVHSTLLIVSGLAAAGVGASLLFAPVAFQASAGIQIALQPSLLSETRASGGALLGMGLLITTGAFERSWSATATLLSAVFYLAYGLSRVLSMVVDGVPAPSLVVAMALELVIGAACLAVSLARRREGAVAVA